MDDQVPLFSIVKDLKEHNEELIDDEDTQPEEEGEVIDFDMSKSELRYMNLNNQKLGEGELLLFAEKVIIVRKSI
jgi:hypothetical protein